MNKTGRIHVYYGDGKGKTTAAMGLALRALGRGMRVVGIQFLKDGNTGERVAMEQFRSVCFYSVQVKKFVFEMDAREKERMLQEQQGLFQRVVAGMDSKECDLFILDEVLGAIETGTFPLKVLLDFLKNKPEKLEVVLTGRCTPDALLELCDYATRMVAVKHPYSKSIPARMGIEM